MQIAEHKGLLNGGAAEPAFTFSEADLAEMLGKSEATVRRYVKEGRLPQPIEVSRECRFWLGEELQVWLRKKAAEAKERAA